MFSTNWYYELWASIPKVPKIASLQCLHSISKQKLMNLIFCMQIKVKFSCKLISTLWASKFSTRWYHHLWWAWSRVLELLKVTSLQYLYNISKKEIRDGINFLHADKHQSFYNLALLFLLGITKVPKIGKW